jgi:hypothetical protein
MLGYDENDKLHQIHDQDSRILAEYKSRSNPGKVYHIVQPMTKELGPYCDCWQWKKSKTCSHLEHYVNRVVPKIKEAQRKALHDDDGAILIAIDKAVSDLAHR